MWRRQDKCLKLVCRLLKMKCLWTLLLILSLSKAQNLGCECQSGTPCQPVDFQTSECIRTPRPDCPCCLVCPQQEDQNCDENSRPCDLSKGLFCNTTISVCQKGKIMFYWGACVMGKNRSKSHFSIIGWGSQFILLHPVHKLNWFGFWFIDVFS